jgi:hypothetical protein
MAAELPVKQVILYKHGVGYFERSGTLAAGESVRLDFKVADMNDVLKSLTVEDKGGGKVTGIRYDSSEPLERKLAEFPFKLNAEISLAQIIDQFKGARLELKVGPQSVAGAIISARLTPGSDKQPEKQEIALLLDGGEMRQVDLSTATSIRFSDVSLQQKFKDYLDVVSAARSREKRGVYIDSSDKNSRQVIASYMIPMPAWKSSYRLIFGTTEEPMLEGWAIVDNTTGDDWVNVRLALISGRPTSFISELYEQKYVARAKAELPDEGGAGPVVYEQAMNAPAPPPPLQKARQFDAGRLAAPMAMREEARVDMASSAAVTTQTREMGELFEYRFEQPVTVKKSESAMIPFLQQKVAARKLLIYSEQQGSVNPLTSAELSNSTGKTLDGGPVTVFDSNAYAGEALMGTLKNGDKRLISYGVDLGARVTTKYDSKANVIREVHMNRGVLTARTARQDVKTYTIRNADQKAKTLIIEHPARPGFKLLSPKPAETTANNYRFEMKLAAGGSETLGVTEEFVYDSTSAVANMTPDVILRYTQNKELSATARKQLERILEQKRQIVAADEEIRRTTTDLAEIDRDQQRVRENINSLNRVAGQQDQVQKYSRQLADQEARVALLRDQQSEARKRKAALETEVNKLLETLEF